MTTSQIRCLLAVLALSETYERVESKNIAHLLGIKRPTVHNSLTLLQGKGLIAKELYGWFSSQKMGWRWRTPWKRSGTTLRLCSAGSLGFCPMKAPRRRWHS